MFEAIVDGFGRAIGGAGVVAVGRKSPALCLSVLPSVMSAVRQFVTRVEIPALTFACIRALFALVLGAR